MNGCMDVMCVCMYVCVCMHVCLYEDDVGDVRMMTNVCMMLMAVMMMMMMMMYDGV